MDLVFYCINEDGFAYASYNSLNGALVNLSEFPNDSIVVALADSPMAHSYNLELGLEN
jgi:hypothetical protein